MKVGKRNRAWLRIAVISATFVGTATPIAAVAGEPITRLGRTLGVGWGDGYHACNDSGLRLLDDLPPRSYPVAQRHLHAHGAGIGYRSGTTYYHHFDAHSSGASCDRCQAAAETAPQTVIMGSQVLRGYEPSQAVAPAADVPQVPVPRVEVPRVEVPSVAAAPSAAEPSEPVFPVTDPIAADAEWDRLVLESETAGYQKSPKVMLPEKQYPLPTEPVGTLAADETPAVDSVDGVIPNTPVFPLASTRASAPATAETTLAPASTTPDPIDAVADRNAPVVIRPIPSRTPGLILPVPPAETPVVPQQAQAQAQRQVEAQPQAQPAAEAPQVALDESLADPATQAIPNDSIEDAYVIAPKYALKPTPDAEDSSEPTATPAPAMATPMLNAAVATADQGVDTSIAADEEAKQADVQDNPFFAVPPTTRLVVPQRRSSSDLLMPPPAQTPAEATAAIEAEGNSIGQSKATGSDDDEAADETVIPQLPNQESETPRLRPHRLGSSTGKTARLAPSLLPPAGTSPSVAPPSVHVNPFAVRPTVELAKRPSDSSGGVIYQPGSNPQSKTR